MSTVQFHQTHQWADFQVGETMNSSQILSIDKIQGGTVRADAPIMDALENLVKTGLQICCVVDDSMRLLGIFTDADVRRGLLAGLTTTSPLSLAFNREPVVATEGMSLEELERIAKIYDVQQIPIINANKKLIGIYVQSSPEIRKYLTQVLNPENFTFRASPEGSEKKPQLDNPYFILAGGLGTRLRTVVSNCPKPLAMVGDRPILQTVIEQAHKSGFRNVFVSVNYMAESIIEHLSSKIYSSRDLNIRVCRETKRLGTAGSLCYLRGEIDKSVVISNADILTNLDFSLPLAQHERENADVTILVRNHEVTIPYGVVDLVEGRVTRVREKPSLNCMVNAGIYVVSPRVLTLIEPESYLDMPDLIEKCLKMKMHVSSYMMENYWLDIGKPEDFLKANEDYIKIFNPGNENAKTNS